MRGENMRDQHVGPGLEGGGVVWRPGPDAVGRDECPPEEGARLGVGHDRAGRAEQRGYEDVVPEAARSTSLADRHVRRGQARDELERPEGGFASRRWIDVEADR